MGLTNTEHGYGAFTKLFHWLIVLLFALQYVAGHIMTRIAWEDVVLGLSQSQYYDWHKSLGLVALAIAVLRLVNRRVGQLPAWAPGLSEAERRFTHRNEQLLYAAMFLMPVTGYVYVMAGGYGVMLFGQWPLPNPIGKVEALAVATKWIHVLSSYLLAASIAGHLCVVLRHQVVKRDGLLWRMWPGRGQ